MGAGRNPLLRLYAIGVYLLLFAPIVVLVLFSFNDSMGIAPDPRIGEWLGFALFLPLAFGLGFQLPLIMLLLERIGVVTVEWYTKQWRISVLVIAVVAMILTPPDPVSMMLMAVPLWLLYWTGVQLCKWMPKGRNPFSEPLEAV